MFDFQRKKRGQNGGWRSVEDNRYLNDAKGLRGKVPILAALTDQWLTLQGSNFLNPCPLRIKRSRPHTTYCKPQRGTLLAQAPTAVFATYSGSRQFGEPGNTSQMMER